MWVVEGTLHPGEQNVTARRRLYLDEDTSLCLMADCYDRDDQLVKTIVTYNYCVPSVPGTLELGYALWNLVTGDYCFNGNISAPPTFPTSQTYFGPQSPTYFMAQEMAASASF